MDDENPQRELRFGLDASGRLLEIVVLLWDDGEVEIIHAIKARAEYRRLVL
ncbi:MULTISPECIES: toxin-antitoxin system toxin subunit [Actinomycetes]|uniref:Toxin-antitoxin system toxin subunit n=1 Tax=Microbacterium profundi TaxID=450380 RepID=A0ABV3LL41_9MICO|nr:MULTISPECIES: toxin-antitoxin system toxin subunit [Microbacterium]MCE7481068.1 toxin-antitoxin system toxin subunit [Microbacterium profundi]